MAVTFDTCAGIQASSTISPRTWTHTIGPGQYGLLMVEIELEIQGDPGTASIQSVTYAGQAMTLLASVGPGGAPQTCIYWYYLLSPPSGANTVSITWTVVYYTEIKATSRNYFGVDPSTPFGTVATLAWGQTATPSVNAASAADEVVIDFLGVLSDGAGGTMTVGAGQTARFSEAVPTPGGSKAIGGSEEAGAPSVTMSWTLSRSTYYSAMMAVSLRPFVVTRTRLVDYQIDEWDPAFGIQDAQGRRLDAWEIEADRWIMVLGSALPTAETYISFVYDPRMAYIESVSWDADQNVLQIATNRGELGDVMIRRAATGSTA